MDTDVWEIPLYDNLAHPPQKELHLLTTEKKVEVCFKIPVESSPEQRCSCRDAGEENQLDSFLEHSRKFYQSQSLFYMN